MSVKLRRLLSLITAIIMCFTLAATAAGYVDTNPNTHRNTGQNIADLIAVAKTQLGYTELSTSTGTPISSSQDGGYTKYGASFGDPTGPWCVYFISWCASQAGISSSVVPRLGNCNSVINWFSGRGRFHYRSSGYTPKTGDFILYNWSGRSSGQHIGIVTGVSGNNVYTIEGNTDSRLGYRCAGKARSLSSSYIVGYCNPAYNDASTYLGSFSFANSVSGSSGSHSQSIMYTTKLSVVTTSATDITSSDAVLHGGVSNGGRLYISSSGFYFGKDKKKLRKYRVLSGGRKKTVDISVNISEKYGKLKPKTTYYYRAYATIDGRDYLGPMYAVVTVDDKPQSIVLSEQMINVGVGQTAELMAALLPIGCLDKGITWSSEDESIATVKDGVILGKGFGKINITAKSKYGNASAFCAVNVLIPCPRNITLKNTATDKIEISWDKVKGASGYVIYRTEDLDSEFEMYKKVDADKTGFTDSDVKPGSRYYYRIMTIAPERAYNSDLSETIYSSATLPSPLNVSASKYGDAFISLTWEKVDHAKEYVIYRSEKKGGLYTIVGVVYDNEYLDGNLEDGKQYFYKVAASEGNAKTLSEYSSIAETEVFRTAVKSDAVLPHITENKNEKNAYIARSRTAGSFLLG